MQHDGHDPHVQYRLGEFPHSMGVPAVKRAAQTLSALLGLACLATSAACGPEGASPVRMHELNGPSLEPLVRPDTPGNGLQFNFEPGDVVETFPSAAGKFLIHFTRNGPNAVPSADADMSGTPDFVEQVASVYDEVLGYYESKGFRPPKSDAMLPDNGGDGKFDVYLVDFAGIGDGTFRVDSCDVAKPDLCAGYMVQENDYMGYGYPSTLIANRILGSHELFHGIQAAYDHGQGSIFAEGSAVWATESFDPSLKDFEAFLDGYFANTGRSLDVPLPGPVDPFSYGAGIFFQFLEERYGDGTMRTLIEHTEDGAFGVADPVWFTELNPVLDTVAKTTFAEAFTEFATWNLFTFKHADPMRSYAAGAGYAPVTLKSVSAPYTELTRLFYAGAQYYRIEPAGRAEMKAALFTKPGDEAQLEDLVMLQVVEKNGVYGDVTRINTPFSDVAAVDMTGVDALVVVLINTAQTGNSRRPTLCIGSSEEVLGCMDQVNPTGGAGGGGGSGGGGGNGGAGGSDSDSNGDCTCSFSTQSQNPGILALVGFSLLVYRRARRRKTSVASAKP